MFSSPGRRGKREMIERAARYGVVTAPAKVDHNTLRFVDGDGNTVIRFHNTNILTFLAEGGFVIDTGHFNTVTTRDRLNKFLPPGWHVRTRRGTIYLNEWAFDRTITVQGTGFIVSDL